MFDIIFEHPDFLVINKHPKVSVHKDEEKQGLLSSICQKTMDEKLFLVHRLDKMTSGILLLARNQSAASMLSSLFAKREVQKYYLAILVKKPNKKQGSILGDMVKSRRGMWKLEKSRHNPAITQFFSIAAPNARRCVLCKPFTGKTHQIRVAMKSIGGTILGDERYGALASDRGYLHAYAISFNFKDQVFEFIEPPSIGEHWLDELPKEWQTPTSLHWPKIS